MTCTIINELDVHIFFTNHNTLEAHDSTCKGNKHTIWVISNIECEKSLPGVDEDGVEVSANISEKTGYLKNDVFCDSIGSPSSYIKYDMHNN